LVEGDKLRAEVPQAERLTRFNYDAPLIAAFMDRWRSETHTFHLPVGEMTLSLEDAAMLGGMTCAGQAMGPIDIPAAWQTDFLTRLANVPQNDRAPAPYVPFVDTTGLPRLGSSSSPYVILTLIFNVCMHFKRM
jgi:hypothetical protein